MTVVLLVIVVAALVGLARGGSFQRLSELELPLWPLVFVAVAVQALGAFAGALGLGNASLLYVAGMVLSASLIVAFVVRNRFVRGMPLVAIGFALNAIVVAANGAMPVDPKAVDRIGMSTIALEQGTDAKHELIDENTRFYWLADVIPVPMPLPSGSNVVSIGDVVLAAGIGVLIVSGMTRRTPAHAVRSAPPARDERADTAA